jgi:hypothetical protein
VKELVNELLMEHDAIDATHVEGDVKNGEVSVTGTVEDRRQRRAIEPDRAEFHSLHHASALLGMRPPIRSNSHAQR